MVYLMNKLYNTISLRCGKSFETLPYYRSSKKQPPNKKNKRPFKSHDWDTNSQADSEICECKSTR